MSYNKISVIAALQGGYCLIKRHSKEPSFEVWLGTSTIRDHVASYNFSDAVKFLLESGIKPDYKAAIKLLNDGGQDES